MKTILHLIIGFIFSGSAFAQTYTLNWASSFSSAWADGATNGNAFNIGGSGINCTVNVTKSGGAFASFSGPMSPTVNSSIIVGGSSKNLQVAVDYTNPSQYTDITFTFSTLVYDLAFNLADIDRLTNTSNSYYDRVTVSGMMGAVAIQPVITKYDAVADPNFLNISGNVAKVNTTSGMAGNTASDATDQKGTIKVSFGGLALSSFTIRYDNSPGVAADPGLQFIGVGNVSFYKSFPLPVELISFEGKNNKGTNELSWKTATENKMAYYAVERSANGKDFNEIGQIASHNSGSTYEYTFKDKSVATCYYRLKSVDIDGSFTYSKVIVVYANDLSEIKVYPTVFTSSLKVRLSAINSDAMQCMLVDLSGKTVYHHAYNVKEGVNELSMELPESLPRGQYFLIRSDNNKSIAVIKQ